MKKVLLFLLTIMLGIASWQVSAQQVVEVGVGGTTTSSYLPIYTLYNNTLSEQIYTPAEITMGGTITSIAFFNGGTEKSPNVKIYMINTDKTSFATTTDWFTVTASDLVFDGVVTFTAGAWTTITLDNPFDYDGVSNLGLIVDGNLSWSSGLACRVFDGTSNCAMYVYSDPTDYNAVGATYTASSRLATKNQLQLEIMPSGSNCFAPASPAISDVDAYNATLSWTPRDGQTAWEVYCGTGVIDLDQVSWTPVTDTFHTFTGLTPATTYIAYVRTNCAGELSNPRQVSFTTEATCASIPSNVVVGNITATTVDVNWTAGADDDAWEVVVVPSNAAPETGNPEQTSVHPYTVQNLQDNTSYKVYVRTDCGGGDHSYWSTAASFTTQPFCSSPLNVTISQISGTSALVSWEPAVFGADSYTVEYSEDSLYNWTPEIVDGTQFMLSGLDPNTTYQVMVYSNCAIGTADTVERSFTTSCFVGGNVAIGNGTTTSYYVPVNNYYNYTYSQQIFLASEMNGPAEITSVSFQYYYGTPSTDKTNVTIYLGHTAKNNFSGTSDYIPATGLQAVYTGNLNCQQGWNTFTFTTPFQYNGTDNLVLAVDDNSGAYDGSSYTFLVHSTGSDYRSLYYYSDSDNPNPSNPTSGSANLARSTDRSNVIFGSTCDNDVTCVRPNVYVVETSESSVTLDWAPGLAENAWEVEYSENDSDWTAAGNATAHPYEVTGLASDTRYTFRVRSNCGSEQSEWSGAVARTACAGVSVPYSEDFDDAPGSGSGNMVTCWTRNTNSTSTLYPYTSNSQHHSGNYSVFFSGGTTTYSYLASPLFDNAPMSNLQVRFWARKSTASYYIQVGIMTDPNDYSTFQQIGQNLSPDDVDSWQLLQVNTDTYTGNGQYIAFRIPADITNSMYIDDVEVDVIPTCEHVSGIHVVVNSVTANAADIEWTEGGTEGSWDVVYGIGGTITDPDAEIPTNVQAPSISLSSLNSNTIYDVYVRAVCSGGESSIWMPFSFRTACGEISTLPFVDNFDSYGTGNNIYPQCWSKINTYSSDRPYINTGGYSEPGLMYFYAGSTGTYNMAITPVFDANIDINTLQAEFMYKASYASDRLIIGVMSDPADATTFVPVDTVYPASTVSNWIGQEVSFASYTGNGHYIAFKNEYTTTYGYGYMDNLKIDLIPSCPKPTHVTAASGASDTVVLSWADPTGTLWDIVYGPAGFDPTEDPDEDVILIEGVTDNPYTITDLQGGGVYDFYVRSNCGGDVSPWCTAPASAVPFLVQMGVTGSATVTGCGFTIIDDGGLNGNYSTNCNYTLTILPSEPGATVVISGTCNTESNWDYLYIYSGTTANEANLLETLNGSVGSFGPIESEDGPITLKFTSDASVTYAGFVAQVSCIAASDCPRPSGFTVGELTSSTVTLSWQGSDEASSWNVAYGPSPLTLDENTPYETVYDTTVTFYDLTSGTNYDFYVRADCGSETSVWRGPISAAPGVFTFGTTGNSSVTACDLTLYDNGGPNGNYTANCNYVLTVYPSDPDSVVSVSGTFAGEGTIDYLSVYEGTSISGTLLQKITSGTGGTVVNFGPLTSESGPLTLKFYSDGSVQYAGFEAIVSCVGAPDCRTPYGLAANNVTADGATISWTADEDATIELYYKKHSENSWTTVTASDFTTNNSYQMTNLDPATTYDVYVASLCTEDTLESTTISFTTLCTTVIAPYSENFAGFNTAASPCWERFSGLASSVFTGGSLTSTTSGWYFNSSNVFPIGHPKVNIYGTSCNYWLVSPSIDLSQLTNPTLMFSLALTDYYNEDPIEQMGNQADDKFMVIISTDNGATWSAANATVWDNTASGDYSYDSISYTGEDVAISLSQYAGQTIRIAFYGESTVSGGDNDLHIADVVVDEPISCPKPTHLTATDASNNSITVSWTPGGSETSWNIEYGPTGFSQGEGTVMPNVTNPVTISGLSSSTTYDFYVQADCGGGETSLWSFVCTAATDCDVVTTLPYTENFDNISADNENAFPICWSRPVRYSGYPYAVTAYQHSAPASLRFQSLTTVPTTAVTPQFAEDIHNLSLNFWLKAESATYSGTFEVGVMTDPEDTATFVGVMTIQPNTSWLEYTINFDTTVVSGANKYIAFRQHSNSSSWYYWLDDVVVSLNDSTGPGPVITDPTVATTAASGITQTSATLNGTITNPDNVTITAKGFEWKVTTGGSYTSVPVTGSTLTYNLTGLTAGTGYTYRAYITYNGTTVTGNEMTFTTLPQGVEPCDVPTGLHTTDVQNESISIAWDNNADVSSWNIQYRPVGGQLASATSNTNSYTITELTGNTDYQIQVQANCGDNNLSEWSAAITVHTTDVGIENHLENNIVLFPNPAKEYVDIRVNGDVNVTNMEVFDVYGKLINTVNVVENPTRINVSGLANGMYFVRVTTEQGVVTKPFVKK